MDDPLLVRSFECFGDLRGNRQRLADGDGSVRDPVGERWPVDQFQNQRRYTAGIFEAIDLRDVRMIE